MTCAKTGGYYQLRLEPGEEIMQTLTGFAKKHRIRSGFLTGIGAAKDLTLGIFEPGTRSYRKRLFRGDHEVCSLAGNVAWDGTVPASRSLPICHIHAVISNSRLVSFAGHLFSGTVTVTLEVALVPGTKRLTRTTDPLSGLKLLRLPG